MKVCDHRAALADLQALLPLVIAAMNRLGPPEPEPDVALLAALAEASGGDWFTSGEMWRLACVEATAAAAEGRAEPDLAAALVLAGRTTSHGLGRWLGERVGQGVERGGEERGSTLWRVRGFGSSETS